MPTPYQQWYRHGTISVTNGSAIVTGTGTSWAYLNNVRPGDLLTLDGTRIFEIASVDSDTQLTLVENWPETTASGINYAIIRNFAVIPGIELVAKQVQIVDQLTNFLDEHKAWYTTPAEPTYSLNWPATVTFTEPDGVTQSPPYITLPQLLLDQQTFRDEADAKVAEFDADLAALDVRLLTLEGAETLYNSWLGQMVIYRDQADAAKDAAQISAAGAATSADNAAASATTASDAVLGAVTSANNALLYSNNAATSATSAATSAADAYQYYQDMLALTSSYDPASVAITGGTIQGVTVLKVGANDVWHAGNFDPAAVNAVQLNGQAASYYLNASNITAGTLGVSHLTGTYNISVSGSAAQLNGQAASYYTNIPARLGYTPVRQGGGATTIQIGVLTGNLTVAVDATDHGINWPINITGYANNAYNSNAVGGISASSLLASSNSVTKTTGTHRFQSSDVLEVSSGFSHTLEVYQDTSGADAFMAFHVASDYAVLFGLKGDINDLAVGGWSMGNTWYRIWHAGNDGASSGLDADLLDGWHGNASAVGNTYALRDSAADIHCRLVRSNYTNQSTISGAIAYRVNTTDNYIRFCSDPAAVRTWLGAASTGANTLTGQQVFSSAGGKAAPAIVVNANGFGAQYGLAVYDSFGGSNGSYFGSLFGSCHIISGNTSGVLSASGGGSEYVSAIWRGTSTYSDFKAVSPSQTHEIRLLCPEAAVPTVSIDGTQVLTTRRTGWTAPSGTAYRGSFNTDSNNITTLSRTVKALIDDLISHGIIGA